jgi:pimeloyl-ACP methyl ester carboxylesterase
MGSPSAAVPQAEPQFDPITAIQYGILVQKAEAVPPPETLYNPGDVINVAYDAVNVNYQVVTTFYGNDLATDINPDGALDVVSFGFIAQDPAGNAVVAIRGTEGIKEWVQDAKFLAVKCPFLPGAGQTEDGFTAVYQSLRMTRDAGSNRLVAALPNAAFPRPLTSLTICGHSLGGALATLFALDVAANTALGHGLTAITYASPRTGNPSFANTYNEVVPVTVRIANRLDLVPKLPLPPLYEHVGQVTELNPLLKVKLDILCQHHLTTYLHLLSLQAGGTVLPLDQGCAGL